MKRRVVYNAVQRSRKIVTILSLIVVLAVLLPAGCTHGDKKAETAAPPKPVAVTPVQCSLLENVISFTGTVEPVEKAEIFSKIPGKVETVYCREGDTVKAGETLIQLEDADLKAAVSQAQAALRMAEARLSQAHSGMTLQNTQSETGIQQAKNAVAQAEVKHRLDVLNLDRMKTLYKNGVIPRQSLDVGQTEEEVSSKALDSARENLKLAKASTAQNSIRKDDMKVARAGIAQAEAALLVAQTQLGYTRITSPVSGVVAFRGVEPGELVAATSMLRAAPLLRVVNNRSVYIEVMVPEKDVHLFGEGRNVRVTVDAAGAMQCQGRVTAILPAADPQNRSFKVKISVDNTGGHLKSGMFARLQGVSYRNPRALLVPREAVLEREGKKVVFVVDGNRVVMREVKTGRNNEKNCEITAGVKSGEQIVTAGQTLLNDGDAVRVEGGAGQ